jgi:flagellum-specific peptidoglycan hydrolase FlgJ
MLQNVSSLHRKHMHRHTTTHASYVQTQPHFIMATTINFPVNAANQSENRSAVRRKKTNAYKVAYKAQMHGEAVQRRAYRATGNMLLVNSKQLIGVFVICCAVFMWVNRDTSPVSHKEVQTVEAGIGFSWAKELMGMAPTKAAKTTGNAYAPISSKQMTEADVNAYTDKYGDLARTEMKAYGIPASISLAQGLVESRAGKSRLARENNNHFGLKCFSKKCHKGHCTNHFDDSHKDFFRKFNSAWQSWRAHSQLLASGRYKALQQHGNDYRAWAKGLKSIGYATDKTYDVKLINVIEQFNLNRFDR